MGSTHTAMSPFAKTILWFVAINAFGGALSLLLLPTFTACNKPGSARC
jgi:hypothetical protein